MVPNSSVDRQSRQGLEIRDQQVLDRIQIGQFKIFMTMSVKTKPGSVTAAHLLSSPQFVLSYNKNVLSSYNSHTEFHLKVLEIVKCLLKF